MKKKRAPLQRGTVPLQKARAALSLRGGLHVAFTEAPRCPEAARFWSERAWSELAAVPAMSQTALALLRDGGDMDSLGALMQIGADEVRHTELSRDAADALGGYVEVIPAGARWEPARLGDPTNMPLAFWLVSNGCISETVSLELMKARLNHTTHAGARTVIQAVVKDEAVHAKIGWSIAERVLPDVSATRKRELAEYARAMIEVIGCTFATAGLAPKEKREARKIREVTAARGLGACPPDEADAVCADTIRDRVIPGLAAFGIAV